jgi:hypothetical protein
VQLGHNKIYNRNLHPSQILPFTIFDDLGSENIGRPAKIRLAKVHASDPLAQDTFSKFPMISHIILEVSF